MSSQIMHVYNSNEHQLRAILAESTSQPCTVEKILLLLLTPHSLRITINRDLQQHKLYSHYREHTKTVSASWQHDVTALMLPLLNWRAFTVQKIWGIFLAPAIVSKRGYVTVKTTKGILVVTCTRSACHEKQKKPEWARAVFCDEAWMQMCGWNFSWSLHQSSLILSACYLTMSKADDGSVPRDL